MSRRHFISWILTIALLPCTPCRAVNVTSVAQMGGPDAQTLALNIANAASGVSVVANSASLTINAPGNPSSNPQSIGIFTNGLTAPGTLLPAANQNSTNDAEYAGGIGLASGVVLCTGLVSDAEQSSPTGRGVGVEGPNNGIGPGGFHPGEIGATLGTPIDDDFTTATGLPGQGDATVLEFQIQTSPSFVRISVVFGSDEYPFYITDPFNDSFAIFIDGENIATIVEDSIPIPFSLQEIAECPNLFIENEVSPAPIDLVGSDHAIPGGAPYYDIEFGGFTKPLTRETSRVLAPGTYTVKIVVQDVADTNVDAGLFIGENSLRIFSFLPADFNLDGNVDGQDFLIWQRNYAAPNPTFQQGDANGDGLVDTQDIYIWYSSYGAGNGNKNYCSDFNRDGIVSGTDFLIWQRNVGMEHCASRFEGDANGDGAVDSCDLAIWQAEYGGGPLATCECGGALMAGSDDTSELVADTFDPADANQDGAVDETDLMYWLDFYGEFEK